MKNYDGMRNSIMTTEDKEMLKTYLNPSVFNRILLTVFVLVTTFIILGLRLLMKELGKESNFIDAFGWIFPVLSTLIILTMVWISNFKILKDLKIGIKHIDSLVLSDVKLDKRESYAYSGGSYNKMIAGSRIEYSVRVGELYGVVNNDQYNQMKIGDTVLVEYAPNCKKILRIEKQE